MKRPISEGRLRYEAMRCETAKCKRCRCRCGGALHGTAHSAEWIAEEILRDRIAFQRQPDQIDWVGYEGFDQYL
ncbi:MAG TPA: hypothetical protein VFB63_19340 [Bryobacteraceae bacterium]|nr:hypothetical protein [Bryobacteraceae bacterium]